MRCRSLATLILIIAGSSNLQAQPVLLQIKPRAGDTLSLSIEQRVEITAGEAEAMRRMTTITQVFSHAVVNQATSHGAEVTALTDSIRTVSFPGGKALPLKKIEVKEGSMRLRVSTDGGAEVLDAGRNRQLAAALGPMPATLSSKAVSVGDTWNREMRIPIAGEEGATGRVRATFQLDSLGRNGDIAFISMHGKLSHDHSDGSISELDGSMTGSMQLDRRLAWITETRATIDVTSMMKPRRGEQPLRVHTRVTQLIKAAPIK